MDELTRWMQQIRSRWNAASSRVRLLVMLGAAAVVAGSVVTSLKEGGGPKTVLFSNLSADDATHIGDRLRTMQVPFEIAQGGTAILVPEAKVHETRMLLASEGLPRGGGVGFEIFDEQRFGESEFSEQVKYHRALEGELSRTISSIAGVERSRVHLVLPTRSLFAGNDDRASASVALHMRPGWTMSKPQVKGIVHLVASSVRALDPKRVTIVDGQGNRLAGSEEEDSEVASNALTYRRELERNKQSAVQQLLDAALGPGKSVVRVAADVNFAREERTEEIVEPEAVSTRSFQIVEEREGRTVETTAGVPGAASNLPGGEQAQRGSGDEGLVRRSETRNYEVSRTVKRAVEPIGRLERLHVAVIVDGMWKGEGEKRKFEPRSAEELARLKGLVQSAVGADTARGDQVTVECVPFAATETPEFGAEPFSIAKFERYGASLGPYVAGLLVFIVMLVWALRSRRGLPAADAPAPAIPVQVTAKVRELESGIQKHELREQALAASNGNGDAEHARVAAATLASRDPEMAARIVRGWLMEEKQ